MRLLSHLVNGEERLAVAIDDRDALDAVDLLGDGPWTMARLLQDVPANLERLRAGLRDTSGPARRPAIHPLASLQLLPPVRPSKVIAIGRIKDTPQFGDLGPEEVGRNAASKGAVLALTRQMQADYAQYGIRVNALLPGTIHTPFVDRYLAESYDDPAAGLEVLRRRQLTGDLGTPEDVAAAALFLASDESRFVLGSGLFVDGGVRGAK